MISDSTYRRVATQARELQSPERNQPLQAVERSTAEGYEPGHAWDEMLSAPRGLRLHSPALGAPEATLVARKQDGHLSVELETARGKQPVEVTNEVGHGFGFTLPDGDTGRLYHRTRPEDGAWLLGLDLWGHTEGPNKSHLELTWNSWDHPTSPRVDFQLEDQGHQPNRQMLNLTNDFGKPEVHIWGFDQHEQPPYHLDTGTFYHRQPGCYLGGPLEPKDLQNLEASHAALNATLTRDYLTSGP